jgi:hypothetical protein
MMEEACVQCPHPGDYKVTFAKGDTKRVYFACAEHACIIFGQWCIDVWTHQFAIVVHPQGPGQVCRTPATFSLLPKKE